MNRGLTGVRADNKYSYAKLEQVASYVREQLKFGFHAAVNPLRLFEDLHEISISRSDGTIIPLRSGVVALEDSEGYAKYNCKHKVIEVLASEKTYEWLEGSHPRAAYFLGHELGHCLLHTDQLIRLEQMPTNQQVAFHRGRTDHKPYEDTEWQANAFASALLMPARGLASLQQEHGYLDAALIVDRFAVSSEAAGYRLELFTTREKDLLR